MIEDMTNSRSLGVRLSFLRRITAAALCIVLAGFAMASGTARQVAESTFVNSNDTQLYVELRGQSERSPILLYLHGGPAEALGLVSFRAYVGPQLESRFLMAYLHQRGVVNSPAVPDSTQTIANHIADVKSVVSYLRNRFPGRHLYLLGHSWGGTLAMLFSTQNPGLIDGLIDVAGPFNFEAARKASYAMTLRWATSTGNADAISELKPLGPPPYRDLGQQMMLSKWSAAAYGGIAAHLSEGKLLSREPFTKMQPEWQDVKMRVIKSMSSELERINLEPRLPNQKTPLLVMVGRQDAVIPPSGIRHGYDLYTGRKKWVELSSSHHLPFVDEPEMFVQAIAGFVR
jgi:proline iminopeptidase